MGCDFSYISWIAACSLLGMKQRSSSSFETKIRFDKASLRGRVWVAEVLAWECMV